MWLRAERRAGELLKELARAEAPNPEGLGGKSGKSVTSTATTQQSPFAQALSDSGMSRQTAHQYQALADLSPVATQGRGGLLDRSCVQAYFKSEQGPQIGFVERPSGSGIRP